MKTLLIAVAVCLAAVGHARAAGPARQPNIIVILADDLGYGDLGCYGATKINTPNIDRLAREGMRFTDAHSPASVCSPSRYGLMTGRSPWRLHQKGNDYHLEPGRLTLAGMLKAQGYRTAAIGKWHLGYSKDWNSPPITGPLEAGFDEHFGVPQNHNDPFRVFIENHDIVGRRPGEAFRPVPNDLPEGVAEPRVDDLVDTTLTAKAVQFIRASAERPFFLYFTPCAPHTHTTPAAPFRGTSQCGLLGDHVQELDAHVGEIMATLADLGIQDETLLIVTSDNGGAPKDFKGSKDAKLNLASEAGDVRAKARTAKADAQRMGHITNGPWSGAKGSPAEGGHRVPFIACWPGRIKAGAVSDQLLCLTDLFATTAELVGATLPADAGEDSFSVLPTLLGTPPVGPQRTSAFIQGDTEDNAIAVRSGTWKMIETRNSRNRKVHRLYDLAADPGETTDLSKAEVPVVRQLAAALDEARATGRTASSAAPAAAEERIAEAIDIAPVWAGHPVGFALLTLAGRQYAAFYDADRHLTIAARRLDSDRWELFRLPTEQAGPPRGPKQTSAIVGWDSHNSIAMAADSAGHIHVAGNMHATGLSYWRTREPGEIASFEQVKAMIGRDEERCTYPVFLKFPDGRLAFQYRSGSSGNGNTLFNVYDVESRSWRRLVDGPILDGEGKRNAYPHPPVPGPDGMFHLSWVWREAPDAAANHDLSYARSRDLVAWEGADGRPVALPITLATPGMIVDPVPAGGGILNGTGQVGFDSLHRPVLAYFKHDAAGMSQAYVARWQDDGWRIVQVSDWNHRFAPEGRGTLPKVDIRLGAVQPGAAGELRLPFGHVKDGSGTWVLDETSLAVKRVDPATRPFPSSLSKVESPFPGMRAKFAADFGASGVAGERFFLRWEALGANRDQPREQPWPPPSQLRVIRVER
jgi:arylsulfatase A-like enzyme